MIFPNGDRAIFDDDPTDDKRTVWLFELDLDITFTKDGAIREIMTINDVFQVVERHAQLHIIAGTQTTEGRVELAIDGNEAFQDF